MFGRKTTSEYDAAIRNVLWGVLLLSSLSLGLFALLLLLFVFCCCLVAPLLLAIFHPSQLVKKYATFKYGQEPPEEEVKSWVSGLWLTAAVCCMLAWVFMVFAQRTAYK